MAKPCSICIRRDVFRIDAALKNGEPFRQIAGRLGLSKSTLARHWGHLKKGVRRFNGNSEAAGRYCDLAMAEFLRDMPNLSRRQAVSSKFRKRKTALRRRLRAV